MYREREAEAFDVLFDRYHLSVYSFARFMLEEAERAVGGRVKPSTAYQEEVGQRTR